ncbi:carbohydrate ABC transporter permease [Dactylosporangium siamense]|uniref:Sugar ABC transporter permease n=1 Tax=Dactylosporangium siamense TaxID=685454 RepID=A0A919PMT7_9ACTN|nr:carbohydrate ABC transporter permease [Dactylosporangium siamense]GIG45023.1 sugar ABC transporter permease [Dactylosporangium siamense]
MRKSSWVGARGVVNLFLIAMAFLALYPFLVMLFGGLKSSRELTTNPGGIPTDPTLDNFHTIFSGDAGAVLWRSLANSFIVTIPFTALTVLFCAMAGYAFARYKFRGRNVLFGLLVMSMLVPTEVNIPTLYVMFSKVDWLNTYQVQILPGTASVLGMFMARQYMAGMPGEVLDAARLDGAGHWKTFWRVAAPMSAPVLGAIAVLTFVAKWSDYLWPVIMVSDPDYQPIMVTLPSLSTSQDGFITRYELLLAGCFVITLPLLAIFLRFQEKLMSGTTAGAVRG